MHFVMEVVQDAINNRHQDGEGTALGQEGTALGQEANVQHQFQFKQMFACEIKPKKRKWIDAIINTQRRQVGKPLICIFGDMRKMDAEVAWCETHRNFCKVPVVSILVVSTSCKDLSPLNHSPMSNQQPILSQRKSPGSTADTFQALLGYLDRHVVQTIIYENSDHVDSDGAATSSMDISQAEMRASGWEGQCLMLNSKLFGVPQNRRRFYAWLVNCSQHSKFDFTKRSIMHVFRRFRHYVQICQRQYPDVRDVLLPEGGFESRS